MESALTKGIGAIAAAVGMGKPEEAPAEEAAPAAPAAEDAAETTKDADAAEGEESTTKEDTAMADTNTEEVETKEAETEKETDADGDVAMKEATTTTKLTRSASKKPPTQTQPMDNAAILKALPRPNEYEIGTVVYKRFVGDPSWYFGFVDEVPQETDPTPYWHVRYEDNDGEDLSERDMDECVVLLGKEGQVARTTWTNHLRRGRQASYTPRHDQRTGTVDIITTHPLYSEIDAELLGQYMRLRRSDKLVEQDATPGASTILASSLPIKKKLPPFPQYSLGTIVYKWFGAECFYFGFVASMDSKTRRYFIQYEDGDSEDVNPTEIKDIVVKLGEDETVALTSRTPTEQDYNERGQLQPLDKPGSVDIITHQSEMYKDLDKELLEKFIQERMAKHQAWVKQEEEEEEKRLNKRTRHISSSESPKKKLIKREEPLPDLKHRTFFLDSNGDDDDKKTLQKRVVEFFVFLYKRQKMWERRKLGHSLNPLLEPKLKSEDILSYDPILRDLHFCNVYRELDRGTAYLHDHIVSLRETKEEWSDLDWLETVLWAVYVYRMVNRVETFKALDGIPTKEGWDVFQKKAQTYHNAGEAKFFTGAHQAPVGFAAYCRNFKDLSKIDLLHHVSIELQNSENVEEALGILQRQFDGVAEFIAWQMLCDLRESGCLEKFSSDTFCYLGPGAKKGLNYIMVARNQGNSANLNATLEEAQKLVELQDEAMEQVSLQFPFWRGRKLTIKEIEHALCEFSKYRAHKSGKGESARIRNYSPHSAAKGEKDKEEGHFCDTCFVFRSKEAFVTEPKSSSWICSRCKKFNAQFPALAQAIEGEDDAIEKEIVETNEETEATETEATETETKETETKETETKETETKETETKETETKETETMETETMETEAMGTEAKEVAEPNGDIPAVETAAEDQTEEGN